MIRILHIDDKREVSVALDEILQENYDDAVLKWFGYFDDGLEELQKNPSMYNGIILDAKCLLRKDDDSLNEQNVTKAIFDIKQIFQKNSIWMPYCVLSGFKEKIEGFLKANGVDGFDKDAEELDALDYIIERQKNVTRHIFNHKFPDLLSFLNNGALEKHTPNILLHIFGTLHEEKTDPSTIKGHIALVRSVMENVFKKLYRLRYYQNVELIPEEYVSKSGSRIQVNNIIGSCKYLNGETAHGDDVDYKRNTVWPSYIGSQCMAIYNVTSTIGNHTNAETGSLYTLNAMFYSLIDLLYWYKGFLKNYS